MAKPKTTTAPTGNIPPFGLRMLPELRAKVEDAARETGRSMNAEVVARLERSFQPAPAVGRNEHVAQRAQELGISYEETLEHVVSVGLAHPATVVFNVYVAPGAPFSLVRSAMNEAQGYVPEDAHVTLYMHNAPPKPGMRTGQTPQEATSEHVRALKERYPDAYIEIQPPALPKTRQDGSGDRSPSKPVAAKKSGGYVRRKKP